MPTVEEVLASESFQTPRLVSNVFSDNADNTYENTLCVTTDLWAVMTTYADWVRGNLSDEQRQELRRYEQLYTRSATFIIDGRPYIGPLINEGFSTFLSALFDQHIYWDRCADVTSLAPGRYVAQFSFETPSDETYSYTWVFERTAAGVIPEVTTP